MADTDFNLGSGSGGSGFDFMNPGKNVPGINAGQSTNQWGSQPTGAMPGLTPKNYGGKGEATAGSTLSTAAPALNFVPVVGPALSIGAKIAGNMMQKKGQEKEAKTAAAARAGGGGGPIPGNLDYNAGQPINPGLTSSYTNFLKGEVGKGVPGYKGNLSAPMNPAIQQMMTSVGPGGTMRKMAETGSPIDQTPQWKAAVAATQQNIGKNEANIREQMSVTGNLGGSPFGQALNDYMSQVTSSENAQLLQQQAQALEQAQGRKLTASEFMTHFGQVLQGLDQGAVDRMYQEYLRTQPEYNPLLNQEFGMAQSFPSYMHKDQTGGGEAALASEVGQLAGKIPWDKMHRPGGAPNPGVSSPDATSWNNPAAGSIKADQPGLTPSGGGDTAGAGALGGGGIMDMFE